MDMMKTVREIGVFEAATNLSKVSGSKDVADKAGALMPLPEGGIESRIHEAAGWVLGFGKDKYMFLCPEIALIEEMGKISGGRGEYIISVPCGLDPESKERLANNLPQNVRVSVLDEPFFPGEFFPGNAMIVISGYLGGDRAMVLPDTYRLADHYNEFKGKIVFVPYTELDAALRYDSWMELSKQKISTYRRCNNG